MAENETTGGKFRTEIYMDEGGEFRWRRKAKNGEIVATSEGYKDKGNAIQSARENFPTDFIISIKDK